MTSPTSPWGSWEILLETSYCKVKKISVHPRARLSYQTHQYREEHWTIVQGNALVVLNDTETYASAGDTLFIPKKAPHRIGNIGTEPLIFIEIQRGSYFGEDDIVRLSDDFNRC